MTDALIPIQAPASTSQNLDAEELTVSGQVVERERMQVTGAAAAEIARVLNTEPAASDYGLVTREVAKAVDGTYLTSASRTTTQTQGDQTNPGARGIAVVLDVTSAGTGDITLTIEGKDPASGKYVVLLAGVSVTTNSTNTYTLFPGATVAANVSENATLWRKWRIKVTANNANAMTYTVGYVLLP